MGFFIENGTGAELEIGDLGLTLEVGEIVDLSVRAEPIAVTNSLEPGEELNNLITIGEVIVKDPLDNVTNLSVAEALLCARSHNDPHYRVGAGARIGDISDVVLTSPVANQVLQFDGSNWINGVVTGGTGNPAPPLTSVQYNDGGAFGGEANFTWDDTDKRLLVEGDTDGQNHLVVHSGTTAIDTVNDRDQATVYIQTDGDATFEGMRIKFQRSTAGISGWITAYYDQAAPSIRLTDEDDDAPYMIFNTIAGGTYDLPEFVSVIGARGAAGTRDPGTDSSGFAWLIGQNTTPEALYASGTYDPAMELDTEWLRIPVGTTAAQPATPVNGMIRYDETRNKFEGYENGAWADLISFNPPKQSFQASNGATTQTLTTTFVTAILGTDLRSDAIYSNTLGEVTVNQTGNFEVTYDITNDSTGARSTGENKLQVNGVDVPGSFAYTYNRNSPNGENTASATLLVSLTAGDVVRVQIREVAGTVVTVANACRLTIREID